MAEVHTAPEWIPIGPDGRRATDGAPVWFEIGRYPETNGDFAGFIEAGGYLDRRFWSEAGWAWLEKNEFEQPAYWGEEGYANPNQAVTGVSFYEAEAYAAWKGAAIPTEREWEAAATNGWSTTFPWGDHDDDIHDRALLAFFGELVDRTLVPVDHHPLGRSLAGVEQLLGTVSEWCHPARDMGPPLSAVLRGGCAWMTPVAVDSYFRDVIHPTTRDNQTGLRLVRRRGAGPGTIPTPAPARKRTSRRLSRPTKPLRQEGIPTNLDEATWRLTVRGPGFESVLSLADLQSRFRRSDDAGMFVCVCRWGQRNTFGGVLFEDLMEALELPASFRSLNVLQRSVPGPHGRAYEATVPASDLIADGALLAWEMDGGPLSLETGWPLRLIDLARYGYKLVKALQVLEFTERFEPGWWEQEKGYDLDGIVRPGVITVVGEHPYRREISGFGRVPLEPEERDR